MTGDRIQACKDYGVTRISYGWQTFAPGARKMMGLMPTEESLTECIKLLRSYDYAVNTDLIYGLPGQTRNDWIDDLKKALDYGFDGIDAFPIQPVPPSPLYTMMRQGKTSVSSNDELLDMLKLAINAFTSAGFVRSNFQRFHKPGVPTSQHKYNNAMFSTDHDVIALGAGAIGMLDDRVYMNIRDIDGYINWRGAMSSPMSCAARMDDDKWVERAFCLQLPWLSKVRKDTLRAPITDAQRRTIEELKSHGLIEETGDEYRLLEHAEGYNFNIARSFVSAENRIRNEEYAESLMREINWKPSVKKLV
jgi:oxygen-independent coproporphyrinogen-3 oxidase